MILQSTSPLNALNNMGRDVGGRGLSRYRRDDRCGDAIGLRKAKVAACSLPFATAPKCSFSLSVMEFEKARHQGEENDIQDDCHVNRPSPRILRLTNAAPERIVTTEGVGVSFARFLDSIPSPGH